MNVALASYPEDFVASADECLDSIDTARDGVDEKTETLLNNLEKMFSERRDLFQKAIDSEGLEKTAAEIEAVSSILDVNSLVAEYSEQYEAERSEKYDAIAPAMNEASTALESAIAERITASESTGEETR